MHDRSAGRVAFVVGSMAALPAADNSVGAIVALYSIVHLLEDSALLAAFAEWRRVLRPDGEVLLAVHEGRRVDYVEEWWGVPVALGFRFFEADELTGLLSRAGLAVSAVLRRSHIEDVELATTRLYLVARPAHPEGDA